MCWRKNKNRVFIILFFVVFLSACSITKNPDPDFDQNYQDDSPEQGPKIKELSVPSEN